MDTKNKNSRINFASTEEARQERIQTLQDNLQIELQHLSKSSYKTKDVKGNIESFIGSIEIPVGLAGPIKLIHDDKSVEDIYAPLATNEGALIASISRGAAAISLAGGFQAKVIKQRMSRCPMFMFEDMENASHFADWVQNSFDAIKAETKRFSNYADLKELTPQIFGRNIHLRFDYETGDASGQNMTTTCTWNACLWIEKNYPKEIKEFVIEANGSSDKKLSHRSKISTRGIRVVSECHIPEAVINKVMKTSSEKIVNLYLKANAMAVNDGMIGYNVNVANAVAAFFAATGQDLGSIHESATGILQMEHTDKGLYVALTLPSLVIGTTGGGTKLQGPQESLKVLNCVGTGKVNRLAKIICGFAMGLEVSTMAAIVSGQFATSHERLGRNHTVEWLKAHELNLELFQKYINPGITEIKEAKDLNIDNGIVSEVTARVSKKLLGFFPYKIKLKDTQNEAVLKLKPLDTEILLGFEIIAGLVSPKLKEQFKTWKVKNPFLHSHTKETFLYRELSSTHPNYIPQFFGSIEIPERETYGLCIEYLNEKNTTHLNTVMTPEAWSLEQRMNVLKAIGEIHGNYFDTPLNINSNLLSLDEKQTLKDFYHTIGTEAAKALKWFNKSELEFFKGIVEKLTGWYTEYLALPRTLIHNDFSPRNMCISHDKPCFYDWELADIAPAQRDLVEFLAFTNTGEFNSEEFNKLCQTHLDSFNHFAGTNFSLNEWQKGMLLSAYDFLIDRLSFYMIGNIINQYNFLNRVYTQTKQMITYLEQNIE